MVAKDILRVLYAPHKVFKDVIQKPGYLGPFILLLIFVLAQVGGSYVLASRSYIETTAPQTVPLIAEGDSWTEAASLWHTNEGVTVRNNTVDFINSAYSTNSIEFTASNTSNVWMELNLGEAVNCSAGGFQNVSFRLKLLTPDVEPENVSLYLYSLNSSNFYYDLTNEFSSVAVDIWNNITLTTGLSSEGWMSNGAAATWENITGLKLDFTWSDTASVDLLIDRLFFKGDYETLLNLVGTSYLANAALNAFAPFLFEWLLLTGLMYLLIKVLKGNVVWKPLMVAVGFALVVLVIQYSMMAVVDAAALPNVNYPLAVWAGVQEESEMANQIVFNELASINLVHYFLQIFVWVWTAALGTFIARAITSDKKIAEQVGMGKASETVATSEVTEFSWMKCLLVSGASVFLTIFILDFLNVLLL